MMRKTIGIVFVASGAVALSICGIILLHWPLPIPGFLLRRIGGFAIFIDPVEAPVWAVLFLTIGIVLLVRSPRLRGRSE
jgi:hypothetical protein